MADLSDEELMLMFKYGQVDAFDLLFERHRSWVLGFIGQMVGDRAAAEDVFQEVFVEVVRAAGRYEVKAKLTTWLYKIASSRCLNHLSSASHRWSRRTVSLDAAEPVAGGLASHEPAPDDAASARELTEIMRREVLRLPPDQRAAFVLRETHGKGYDEIADILGQPLGTIKTHLHRARQAVRDHMRRHLP